MKKALVIGLLCVLVGCSDPTGGGELTITKHGNGKTASRGYMLNDHIKVGDWVYFFEDGQKEKQGTYHEDQKHGTWTFYGNGQKGSERPYKNGELEGVWTSWHENGKKWGETTYKDGQAEGVWTYWHDNGQKKTEGTMKDDKKDGVWTYWDVGGNVTEINMWKSGKMWEGAFTSYDIYTKDVKIETYTNGKLVQSYKNGKPWEGVFNSYDNHTKDMKTETYKDGELVK
jgi:antitoxin component YwqK of YwqJK toxin-antitoxin module